MKRSYETRSKSKCRSSTASSTSSQGSSSEAALEWVWEHPVNTDFVHLTNDNRDVKFHKNYSIGTAVVRGSEPMTSGQHFWEVKMMSPVYGTDVMIGVGTPEANMSQREQFVSLLGIDNKTWGLSYTGQFRHNGRSEDYSSHFGRGCVIGVHLDMWNGTLSFYKNKKHLGVASRGLKGKTLYAMASSTAACSMMRILKSCSFPSSLQYLCCARLRELIPDDKHVLKEVDLPPGLQLFLKNNLGWLLDPRCFESRNTSDNMPCDWETDFEFLMDLPEPVMESVSSSDDETIFLHPMPTRATLMRNIQRGLLNMGEPQVLLRPLQIPGIWPNPLANNLGADSSDPGLPVSSTRGVITGWGVTADSRLPSSSSEEKAESECPAETDDVNNTNSDSSGEDVEDGRSQSDLSRSQSDPSRSQSDPSRSQSDPSLSQSDPSRSQSDPSRSQSDPSRSQSDSGHKWRTSLLNMGRARVLLTPLRIPGLWPNPLANNLTADLAESGLPVGVPPRVSSTRQVITDLGASSLPSCSSKEKTDDIKNTDLGLSCEDIEGDDEADDNTDSDLSCDHIDTNDDHLESNAKRRCLSYNYAVGLSDPESD